MKPTLKQKILGAILLFAILAIAIPLFITPNHSMKRMESKPPQPPEAPKINLKLPPLPKEPTSLMHESEKPSIMTTLSTKIHQIKQKQSSALPDHQKSLLHWHSTKNIMNVNSAKTTQNIAPPSAWRLRLGSFSNKHNANKLVTLLRNHHFDAYKLQIKKGDANLYQVFIGPTVSKLEAKMMRKHLLNQLGLPSLLVQVPVKH